MISRPAVMLPRAKRVMGLVIAGLFSFIEMVGVVRVKPVWTSRDIRRL